MKINLARTFMTMVAMGTCMTAAERVTAQQYGTHGYAQPQGQFSPNQAPAGYPGYAYRGAAASPRPQPSPFSAAPYQQPQPPRGQYQPPGYPGAPSARVAAAPSSTYRAPARWNQYRAVQNRTLDEADSLVENLPSPMLGNDDLTTSPSDLQLQSPERMPTPAPQVDRSQQQPIQGQPYGRPSEPQSFGTAPQHYPAPQANQPAPSTSYSTPYSTTYPSASPAPSSTIYGSPYSSMDHGLVTETTPTYSSPYQSAMTVPHDQSCGPVPCSPTAYAPVRPQLYPWFASANVLFLDLETGKGNLAFRNYDWRTSLVDPDNTVGFDAGFGRYFGCGRYGLGVRYFGWNPGEESVIRDIPVTTATNTNQTAMPHYDDIGYNDGGPDGQQTLTDHIDGHIGDGVATPMANGRAATRVRLRRDLQFNSVELNLFSFGLMGAQRVAYGGCDNSLLGRKHGGRYGFGGAVGPLARSSSPRVRVATSHGFRWFQAEDEFEYAYNIDGGGYGNDDLYDNFQVENNLYGYQFGSFLTYCLGSRLNLNVGGKIGIYGNDVDVKHRIGSRTLTAYDGADNTNRTDRHASDTVLASLGELDLGLGYRINNAWTVNGGYKVLGVTGVANAIDSYPGYDSVRELHVRADNSYLIHGAYVGLGFNW